MYAKKTLGALLLAIMMTVVGVPSAVATPADCEGDPCAAVKCSVGEASAHAVGSEHAWAKARVGDWEVATDGPGTAHAEAAGTGDVSASAKGKKDWSLKEANASCSGKSTAEFIALFDALADIEVRRVGTPATQFALPDADALTLGCVANDLIVSTESFTGRLYATSEGGIVAYDALLGLGVDVVSLDLTFDGETLRQATPMDVTGLQPLDVFVQVDLTNAGELGTACNATLYA